MAGYCGLTMRRVPQCGRSSTETRRRCAKGTSSRRKIIGVLLSFESGMRHRERISKEQLILFSIGAAFKIEGNGAQLDQTTNNSIHEKTEDCTGNQNITIRVGIVTEKGSSSSYTPTKKEAGVSRYHSSRSHARASENRQDCTFLREEVLKLTQSPL